MDEGIDLLNRPM